MTHPYQMSFHIGQRHYLGPFHIVQLSISYSGCILVLVQRGTERRQRLTGLTSFSL